MVRQLLESEAVGVKEKAHVVCAEEAAVKATADTNRMSLMNDRRRRRLPLTPARQGGTLPIPIEIGVVIFARESEMPRDERCERMSVVLCPSSGLSVVTARPV